MAADQSVVPDAEGHKYVLIDCEDEEQWQNHDELWTKPLQDGMEWSTIAIARGEKVDLDILWAAKGVLLTGSHHCATDASLPWRSELAEAMITLVRGKVPAGRQRPRIVGVCFGCQLLADVLGGRAGPNPSGAFVLGCEQWCLSDKGASLFGDGTPPLNIIETHGDCVIQLPDDGHVLASSKSCAHELFTISSNVLGMQGHPEFNADEVMTKILPDVETLPGVAGREKPHIRSELQATSGTQAVIRLVGKFLSSTL